MVHIKDSENEIKLVIFDLDETFWKGTLSEGAVSEIALNIQIVKTLIDRGIMCSIVSKNNYSDAMSILKKWAIDDLFIFPHISWESKGHQVKKLLEECSLRPQNTLFIDDNVSNLKEVEYYNKGILTSLPKILDNSFLDLPQLQGKNDISHSRLKQYKIKEVRHNEAYEYESNEDFLRASDIEISVVFNPINEIDRIYELVQRTNQLNYTKNRMSKNSLLELICDCNSESAAICVRDKFGNYGIVGFYAFKDENIVHFLFSCRILGFGIENYMYKKIGFPYIQYDLNTVAVELSKEQSRRINWISEIPFIDDENKENKNKQKLLLIGGCDLESASIFLEHKFDVVKEFPTVIDGIDIRTSDTTQLVNNKLLDEYEQDVLCRTLPFFSEIKTFKSKLYDNECDLIVISLVDDYIKGFYKNLDKNYNIMVGAFFENQEYVKEICSEDSLKYLDDNFEYIGKIPLELFYNNIKYIVSNIDPRKKIVLVNGPEIDVSDWIGNERVTRNIEMNAVIDRVVREYNNVELLDMREIVKDRKQLVKKDNRHFNRQSYYQMAQELIGRYGS